MAELHDYDVEINGQPTTLRLTEEDAKERGFTDNKRADRPANKARGAANKGGGGKAAAPVAAPLGASDNATGQSAGHQSGDISGAAR